MVDTVISDLPKLSNGDNILFTENIELFGNVVGFLTVTDFESTDGIDGLADDDI